MTPHSLLAKAGSMAIASMLPVMALAGPEIDLTFGSGPDGFRAQTLSVGANVAKTPLHLGLNHFESTVGESVTRQQGVDLSWNLNDDLTFQATANRTEDASFDVVGKELEVSYDFSEPQFTAKLKIGSNDYSPNKVVPAAVLDRIPVKRQIQLTLSKKVTDAVSIDLSGTTYRYSTDPLALAQAIASRRRGSPPGAAFTFSAFPEHAWTVGMGWKFNNQTSANLSTSSTRGVTDQH